MGIDSVFYGVYHSPDVLFNRNPIQPPIFRGGNADSLFEYS